MTAPVGKPAPAPRKRRARQKVLRVLAAPINVIAFAAELREWRRRTGNPQVCTLAQFEEVVRLEEAQATLVDPRGTRARLRRGPA